MPLIHHARREIVIKVVYFGPGLGGKTTNLRAVHRQSRPNQRGKLVSIDSGAKRTLFLDFLPVDLGTFRDYRVRVHLCTVPGQVAQEATRALVLRHVDGVVFVVDSQRERIDANNYSLRDLYDLLNEYSVDPTHVPMVVQYNKRDLPNALGVDELRTALGVPDDVPEAEACAEDGSGVFETLKSVVTTVLKTIGDPTEQPEGYVASRLAYPRGRFRPSPPESVIEALRPNEEQDIVPGGKAGSGHSA